MFFRKKKRKPMSTKRFFILFGIILVTFIFLKIWEFHWPSSTVILDGQQLHVLVANTPDHLYKGLSNRKSLSPYDGMLFLFSFSGSQKIVMRHMNFPLDIVWIEKGKIVHIEQQALPDNRPENQLTIFQSLHPATVVLELPAGWVAAHGTKIGDIVKIGS